MRTHNWIKGLLAAPFVVLGLAACTDEAVPPEETTSTVTEEIFHPITFTTYYAEPEHIHIVGHCTNTICPQWPKGTFCTGRRTDYFTAEFDTCD